MISWSVAPIVRVYVDCFGLEVCDPFKALRSEWIGTKKRISAVFGRRTNIFELHPLLLLLSSADGPPESCARARGRKHASGAGSDCIFSVFSAHTLPNKKSLRREMYKPPSPPPPSTHGGKKKPRPPRFVNHSRTYRTVAVSVGIAFVSTPRE